MHWEAVYHVCDTPYAFAVGIHDLKVRLRVKRGDAADCTLLFRERFQARGAEKEVRLEKIAWDRLFDYYEGVIRSDTGRLRYVFYIQGADGTAAWFGGKGMSLGREEAGVFVCPHIDVQDLYVIPEWVHDAVVYQIFPERFCNGNTGNDPEHTLDWDREPTQEAFFGGDLQGVIAKLPYLKELGVNTIYLTPVFTSPSNHKYNTIDYFEIDPHFGDMQVCREMVKSAHQHGIRVIFDGVFNHCGDHFFAFQDVLQHGQQSKYTDWFHIKSFPVVQQPVANYETFGTNKYRLPKLNTSNPEVRDYLLKVAEFWISEADVDGWRLDVANEVEHGFWRDFRKVVKKAKPDAVIIGEIWHDSGKWLRGDQLDGVMNYLFRDALLDFFARRNIGVHSFNSRLTHARMMYPDQANASAFNLIGSHDTERFFTACGKAGSRYAEEQMKLAVFFQLTYLGMPMIYYGDEAGMEGEAGHLCRKPMVWEEHKQNLPLLDFYRKLLKLRKDSAALRRGDLRIWVEDEMRSIYGYLRSFGDKTVGMLLNNSTQTQIVQVNTHWKTDGGTLVDLLTQQPIEVSAESRIELPAFGFVVVG